MSWEKAKNFVMGGGFLIIGGLLLAYMEWRISVGVSVALSSQDIGTDAKIVSMDTNIASNAAVGSANKDDIEDNKRRVEQAFAVLLGRTDD